MYWDFGMYVDFKKGMNRLELKRILSICTLKLRRMGSILLIAFMLGVSNVILEETRTIDNTKKQIELREEQESQDT